MAASKEARRVGSAVAAAAEEESRRATALLRSRFNESGLPIRAAERYMGWGQGTLNNVLAGTVSLRFDHVAAVAAVCGFDLGEFYVDLSRGKGGKERGSPPRREDLPPELERQIRGVARKLFEEMERAKERRKRGGSEPEGGSNGED